MAKRPKFTLSFAPEAIEHLDGIDPKYHGMLCRTIKEQLTSSPTEETRNRKPLEQPAPLWHPGNFAVVPIIAFGFFTTWILHQGP